MYIHTVYTTFLSHKKSVKLVISFCQVVCTTDKYFKICFYLTPLYFMSRREFGLRKKPRMPTVLDLLHRSSNNRRNRHLPEYPISRTISRTSSIQGSSDLQSNSTLSSPRTIDVTSVHSSSSSSDLLSSPELEQHFRCSICHYIITNPAPHSIHICRRHRR